MADRRDAETGDAARQPVERRIEHPEPRHAHDMREPGQAEANPPMFGQPAEYRHGFPQHGLDQAAQRLRPRQQPYDQPGPSRNRFDRPRRSAFRPPEPNRPGPSHAENPPAFVPPPALNRPRLEMPRAFQEANSLSLYDVLPPLRDAFHQAMSRPPPQPDQQPAYFLPVIGMETVFRPYVAGQLAFYSSGQMASADLYHPLLGVPQHAPVPVIREAQAESVAQGSSSTESNPGVFSVEYISTLNSEHFRIESEDYEFGCCRDISEYERVRTMARGAFGVVFQALEVDSGKNVAVKRIQVKNRPERDDRGAYYRTIRETTFLHKLNHKNIVTFFEVAVSLELCEIFIVMDYSEQDLRSFMEKMNAPFTRQEVKCLMEQLFEGLDHIHYNFVLHRDIKPTNILVDAGGILKICDFGLARLYGSPNVLMTPRVVTLAYRPPEVLLGTRHQTPGLDMWSAGCVFAEMLLHKPILPGRSEIEQFDMIIELLGAPTEDDWPGLKNIPVSGFLSFSYRGASKLRSMFPSATEKTVDLLCELICFDPDKRLPAGRALDHPYFDEEPMSCDPALLPHFVVQGQGRPTRNRRPPSAAGETIVPKHFLLTCSNQNPAAALLIPRGVVDPSQPVQRPQQGAERIGDAPGPSGVRRP